MNACMESDREPVSLSSPPQLKGVPMCSTCAGVCLYYFANPLHLSVCLYI